MLSLYNTQFNPIDTRTMQEECKSLISSRLYVVAAEATTAGSKIHCMHLFSTVPKQNITYLGIKIILARFNK